VTVRFLIDEDLDPAIVTGLRLRAPTADVVDVKLDKLRGSKDHVLLELAHAQGRVLVTGDRNTMPRHFGERLASGRDSAGACILDTTVGLGELIEALLLVWSASSAEEYVNRVVFLPYR
jgi:hypothetical protein